MKAQMIRLLKRLLPRKGYARLRDLVARLRYRALRLFASTPAMSLTYYAVRPSVFGHEAHAVLNGRRAYFQDLLERRQGRFLLRRNVHRLEKGLVMRPRRPTFATSYIGETVDVYRDVVLAGGELHETRWAHDVLTAYFDAVTQDPEIDRAHDRFLSIEPPPPVGPQPRSGATASPYHRDLSARIPDFTALKALAERRRSVRWYEDRPVPRELLDQAFLVAAQAPSACNRQSFEFRVFDRPERVSTIAALPLGTAGFHHNFPVIIAIVGRQRAYFDERDRHLIYIDASLAAMSFMLALETLGLSSCPINWPDVPRLDAKMRRELDLERDERVVMLLSVGYPDLEGMVPYSQKRALDELRRYD